MSELEKLLKETVGGALSMLSMGKIQMTLAIVNTFLNVVALKKSLGMEITTEEKRMLEKISKHLIDFLEARKQPGE